MYENKRVGEKHFERAQLNNSETSRVEVTTEK